MAKNLFVLRVVLLCISIITISGMVGVCYADSRITHRLDIQECDVVLVCVRTAETVSYGDWISMRDAIKEEYPDRQVIVTRDAMIYHRAKRIKQERVSREYINTTLDLARKRNG